MGTRSCVVSDLDIQALVDNELSEDQVAFFVEALGADPVAKRRFDDLVVQKKMLRDWWHKNN